MPSDDLMDILVEISKAEACLQGLITMSEYNVCSEPEFRERCENICLVVCDRLKDLRTFCERFL